MIFKAQLDVKFRAFFITFAQWHVEWTWPIPPIPPIQGMPPLPALDYSRSGVRLRIDVTKA